MKQKRAVLAIALLMMISALGGCSGQKALSKYQLTLLDYFDTVTTITGYAEKEETFSKTAEGIREELEAYDRLYDIYTEYPGMVNLCTINSHPGETMTVDQRIIDLLMFAREADDFSGHRTSAMLGSVLRIWHEAREAGIADPEHAGLPDETSLRNAMEHTGFELLEIDPEDLTVRITDPEARIDVGAMAKGYAVQRIAEKLPEGFLISAGGNVAATGTKPDGSAWVIGIQNPDGEGYLRKVSLKKGAVVTSGDYQRYYLVDGKAYHHIIDPETLYPAERWRSVTVVCADSGTADALSTTLFLMDQEDGQKLLERFQAEAMWIGKDGTESFSPGFQALIKD